MSIFARFLGRGDAAVTVPPLDGGLKPNNRLEELPQGLAAHAPDAIAAWQGGVLWSEGNRLMTGPDAEFASFASEITALATSATQVAVATSDGIRLLDQKGRDITPVIRVSPRHVTALAFSHGDALYYASGSESCSPQDWRRDLMEMNRTGSVGQIDLATGGVRVIARGLGYPAGIMVRDNGHLAVSEAWRSQIIDVDDNGRQQVVLDEIPGYPGRLTARPGGGAWLCIFAPRSPLFEFVLREPAYRKAMLRDLDPAHWVAPKYSSGQDFHEPMQGGALKQMGILKPWAPTLSYGLVVALDRDFVPQGSFHSRAGGRRHGITGAAEIGDQLFLAGRGSNEILTIDLAGGAAQ
jgi:hypothetical protein